MTYIHTLHRKYLKGRPWLSPAHRYDPGPVPTFTQTLLQGQPPARRHRGTVTALGASNP